jgi:bifunctional DNase/RNase
VIQMELNKIIISENTAQQVIVLKESAGARAFPIVIGLSEAIAIDRNFKAQKTPRPMTHDLVENVIRGLDARLERIVVTDLKDRTFFAKLILRRNGKTVEVDSRPSDAIAVAVLMKVPIYVEERVLEDVIADPSSEPPDLTPDEDDDE